MTTSSKVLLCVFSLVCLALAAKAPAQPLPAIDKNTIIATLHAVGAQIYECKPVTSNPAGKAGALAWEFREPIASLLVGSQSVGRHYAGPSWDLADGSRVKGRVVKSTPAATANDVPWLELEVVDRINMGILSDAVTVLRISTKGGLARG